MAEKLTDRTAKTNNFADADVFHLVDVSDTSQDPAGSSFKVESGDYFTEYLEPKINSLSIPLSGTTTGNPVTGDIEFEDPFIGSTRRIYVPFNGGEKEIAFPDDGSMSLTVNDVTNGEVGILTIAPNGVTISATNIGSAGLTGQSDFSPNITDLDYTQKIYVDTVAPTISSGTGAPATTPTKIGDIYIDTSAPALYFSKGVASSADWIIV
jgi:hypothetical protein